MPKHTYTPSQIIEMKKAVVILRRIQETIEDDKTAYAEIDSCMCGIEDMIDKAEEENDNIIKA